MKKALLGALVAATLTPALAADYYVVLPTPGKTVSRSDIRVALGAAALPSVLVGAAYSYDFAPLLQVTGDSKFTGYGVKWVVSDGSLPPGVTLNAATGVLSGAPTTNGTWPFTISATYMTKAGQQSYQVAVTSLTVALDAATPPQALAGTAYTFNLAPLLKVAEDPAFTGAGVTWSVVASTLPAGLSLSADGRITGTATAAGKGSLTARATYRGSNGQQTYEIVVLDITVALAGAVMPVVVPGTGYSYDLKPNLSVTGDPAYKAADVTWSVGAGALPAGLSLDANTGVISGTPGEFANEGATVTVAAAYKAKSATRAYTLYPKDPHYDKVTLQAHMDAEPFVNTKTGAALTSYGGPLLTTATKKFGAGAASTTGAGKAIGAPAFRPAGDYTIEGWFLPTGTASTIINIGGISQVNWQSQAVYFGWPAAGQITWVASSANNGTDISNGTKCAQPCSDYVAFGAPTLNAWNHFAVVYSTAAGQYYLYLNGTRTATVTSTKRPYQSSYLTTIGGYPTSTQSGFGGGFAGYLDEFRLTDGVARYTQATYALPAFARPDR